MQIEPSLHQKGSNIQQIAGAAVRSSDHALPSKNTQLGPFTVESTSAWSVIV